MLDVVGSFRNEQPVAFRWKWKRLIDDGCVKYYEAFKEEGGYGIRFSGWCFRE